MLKEALLAVLLNTVQVGGPSFSVEVAKECPAHATTCAGARKSSFYGTWVKQESLSTAEVRVKKIVDASVEAAKELLCVDQDSDCVPYPGTVTKKGERVWTPFLLSSASFAASVYESGLREDVMVGRGWAKKASDDGGKGRGPGMEGCLMQIHPTVIQRFADIPPTIVAHLKKKKKGANEELMQTLLGEQNLKNCFKTGMRMLLRADSVCQWQHRNKKHSEKRDFAMYSMYGTGNSCSSSNQNKTMLRAKLFRKLTSEVRADCVKRGGSSKCEELPQVSPKVATNP
jgi:hypothetical protein